mmetsp:Transcript_33540/g.94171  ORF Transcript_33540/g.94171 Transcript_33540/m.94171 type:complete len:237 (+) Transcript_33540:2820-3530(+)
MISSQGAPSLWEGASRWRVRTFWPPHVAEHRSQSDQSAITHGFGSALPQPSGTFSSGPGLHGAISLTASLKQVLPLPVAWVSMRRWRSATPKHLSLHGDHLLQPDSAQSLSWMQLSECVHTSYSVWRPTAGFPQSFGCFPTSRCRDLNPLLHVTEQSLHSSQSFHAPSMHTSQLCVLHGATSDLSSGGHGLPPRRGTCFTARSLRVVPPPQRTLHAPHSDHPSHRQSFELQSPWIP